MWLIGAILRLKWANLRLKWANHKLKWVNLMLKWVNFLVNLDYMKMASYAVIYPNIVGISHGCIYGLEWKVVANGLSILEKNDAYLL